MEKLLFNIQWNLMARLKVLWRPIQLYVMVKYDFKGQEREGYWKTNFFSVSNLYIYN